MLNRAQTCLHKNDIYSLRAYFTRRNDPHIAWLQLFHLVETCTLFSTLFKHPVN